MPLDFDLRLGWIPYLNLLPLEIELKRVLATRDRQITFFKGHPKDINLALKNGMIDLAPASSINILQDPNMEISLPLGIYSDGSVDSVYIGFRLADRLIYEHLKGRFAELGKKYRKLFTAETSGSGTKPLVDALMKPKNERLYSPYLGPRSDFQIRLSAASATSNALCKILCHILEGTENQFSVTCIDYAAAAGSSFSDDVPKGQLLIGDEALLKKSTFPYILDLGHIWQQLTGLPFVFAVWQTGPMQIPMPVKETLIDAAHLAQRRKDIDPAFYLHEIDSHNPILKIGEGSIKDYWKKIKYVLDDRAIRGLMLFFQMANQCCYKAVSVSNSSVAITRNHHRILNLTNGL